MPPNKLPAIVSVHWSTAKADISQTVTLFADLINVDPKKPVTVTFNISEYSGLPPSKGGGESGTVIDTKTVTTNSSTAQAQWVVKAVPESSDEGGIPEYRFRATLGGGTGVASSLLKVGQVTRVVWIDPVTGDSRSDAANKTQAFFPDTEEIELRLEANDLKGFSVDFEIYVKNPLTKTLSWKKVHTISAIPLQSGVAKTTWHLSNALVKQYAFGVFRFHATLAHSGVSYTHPTFKSGYAYHYTRVLGIYGAGPTGSDYANSELAGMADSAHGVVVGRGTQTTTSRLAAGVAPEEANFRIFGYSRGALAAVEVCRKLSKRPVTVKLLIGIDPISVTGSSVTVPDNVQQAKCFYQTNGSNEPFIQPPYDKGDKFFRADGSESGIDNTPVPNGLHETMPALLFNQVVALLS